MCNVFTEKNHGSFLAFMACRLTAGLTAGRFARAEGEAGCGGVGHTGWGVRSGLDDQYGRKGLVGWGAETWGAHMGGFNGRGWPRPMGGEVRRRAAQWAGFRRRGKFS